MASISRDAKGNVVIQFIGADKKRRSIRLGKLKPGRVDVIRQRVEALNSCKRNGQPLDGEVLDWLAKMPDEMHRKLAKVGLVEQRGVAALGPFIDLYIAGRTDLSGRSHLNMGTAAKHIKEFFGVDREMRAVKPSDADRFVIWAKGKFAQATVARMTTRAREFFAAGVRARCVTENPFAHIKPGNQDNEERKFHVKREVIYKVLDACPNADWRAIIALSRFGGLRCPSEILRLKWVDVLWAEGKIIVRKKKTKQRFVPIFPELLPYLRDSFEAAAPGAIYVVSRYRGDETNLRTTFEKIIARAGQEPWPRLFHNMRASRETELAADFPMHVVCAWIGNSKAVAVRNYLTVRDEDYQRAASGAAISGAVTHAARCTEIQPVAADAQKTGENGVCASNETSETSDDGSDYPRQDSNLHYDLRGVACYPLHHEDELNPFSVRTAPCER